MEWFLAIIGIVVTVAIAIWENKVSEDRRIREEAEKKIERRSRRKKEIERAIENRKQNLKNALFRASQSNLISKTKNGELRSYDLIESVTEFKIVVDAEKTAIRQLQEELENL